MTEPLQHRMKEQRLMAKGAHVTLAMQPQRLRCEHLENPRGIDVMRPRMSWRIEGRIQKSESRSQKKEGRGQNSESRHAAFDITQSRGVRQAAYRILVASSAKLLAEDRGDLWDSGKVRSDASTFIEYAGRPLQSRMPCYWKVKVWLATSETLNPEPRPLNPALSRRSILTEAEPRTLNPKASAWSAPAMWTMGLLRPGDWRAQWIGAPTTGRVEPAPLLRKSFSLRKDIRRATVYICGLGYYELSLNGRKVGDHVLDPKVTRYDRRVLYVMYDVTAQLRAGANAVGVMLGNGWYNYHVKNPWHFDRSPWRAKPRMMLQLEVEYADGTTQTIVSDRTWKYATGAVRFDGMLNGEIYDARLEQDGWDTAGYDDAGWRAAGVVKAPQGRLCAQMVQPIRVIEVLKPVKLTQPKPGVYVYDLGQNIAGAARLTVTGPAGTRVKLQYGELLHPDGTLNQTNINIFCKSGEFQTEHYILKGRGVETWQARFMYYGYQYVQVTGFPGKPTLDNLAGLVLHTDVENAGRFECSHDLLNKIQHCNRWSYLNNFHGYPTDCPHREKIGWTGDAHIAGATGLYNFEPAAVYRQWLRDFTDEQQPDGALPGIIPTGGWGYQRWGGPAWCSACILLPWYLYQYRSDVRILAELYPTMRRYVDYLTTASPGGINRQGMGDWFPAKTKTPVAITSTSHYYADALILSKIAVLLGRKKDAARYARLATGIKQAFNRRFFDRKNRQYGGGTQTANACALYQGLVEAPDVAAVVKNLAENVERNDNHLDGGILGAQAVLHALTDHGRVDLAYKLAAQTTWPSWGDMIRQGATTLWEGWNADIGTHNHVMLGDISAWFFATLAGISGDPEGPGFKKIIIKPRLAGDLTWVKAQHDSPHGRIVSRWRRRGARVILEVTIPINTTAVVHVPVAATCPPEALRRRELSEDGPAKDAAGVTESGRPTRQAKGVKFLRMEAGAAVYAVGSGSFRFESGR